MANCSSTPLVDLIARCELYAKVIEGIFVVDDEWQPGEAGRQEPRETLLSVAKILHSIRAQGTISPEYAAELGRQVDELEAENATLRAQCAGEPVAWRWLIHGIYHYSGGFPVSGAEALYLRPTSTLTAGKRETP